MFQTYAPANSTLGCDPSDRFIFARFFYQAEHAAYFIYVQFEGCHGGV